MARKMCNDCGTRPTTSESPEGQLCTVCWDYAGEENRHSDDGHDAVTAGSFIPSDTMAPVIASDMETCPVCHPELDKRSTPARVGHTNTATTSGVRINHADCAHPRNPKGRAACRAAGGPVATAPVVVDPRDHSGCTHTRRGNGACVGRRLRALKS